jgi:hypothetical protein
MTSEDKKSLQARIEVPEVQQAVMAGFIAVLLQTELQNFPEPARNTLWTTYESLFERTIASLLASELGFSDAAVRAIEDLKVNMMRVTSEQKI